MAFKFLQVGKANAEIDRLNDELSKVTKERDDAQAAVAENSTEVAKEAENLQGELKASTESVTKLTGELATANAAIATKDAELKVLADKLAAKDGEVKITVAREVANTQAALGQPPVPAVPAAATTASALKGKDRMAAAIKAELDKSFPMPVTR